MEESTLHTESLRLKVSGAYYRGQKSIRLLAKEFGIPKTTVHNWIKKYRPEGIFDLDNKKEITTFEPQKTKPEEAIMKKDLKDLEKDELLKYISEQDKKLEYQTMRADIYEKMVDIAERDLNIPVRKKYGAKQFKK